MQDTIVDTAANPMGDLFDEPSVTMTGTATDFPVQMSPNQAQKGFPLKMPNNLAVHNVAAAKGMLSTTVDTLKTIQNTSHSIGSDIVHDMAEPMEKEHSTGGGGVMHPITVTDNVEGRDAIPPSAEATTPVLGAIPCPPIIEDDHTTRLIRFPILVPVFAKAAKVNPEMQEEWCKKALRLYDPSDDLDQLMKDPELIPTLGDELNGDGSVGTYSARDDSSSASTLPNELFFGLDPFDPRNERFVGYEGDVGVDYATVGADAEELANANKALITTLEKTTKFNEMANVYTQQ
ncbi:hypothetical protein RFI_12088, partial [Reticulomyxa filosa]